MSKQSQMNKISREVRDLTESPLYAERVASGSFAVIGEGSLDAAIMCIGEAPGKNEAATGKPFCGASGKVLDQLLDHIGISRKDIYITNVVKDRPAANRDPKPTEISLYAPFLYRQIEIIQPKIIATLGRFSMEFMMSAYGLESKRDTISNVHGKVFKIKTTWGDVLFVPLYHPAVAVYNRTRLDELKKDMMRIKRLL